MSSQVWRTIAIALATFIAGTLVTWLIQGGRPTRDDVISLIHEQAASAADFKQMQNDIISLKIEEAQLVEKINELLMKSTVKP